MEAEQNAELKRIYSQPVGSILGKDNLKSHSVHEKVLSDNKSLNLFFVSDSKNASE